MKMCLKYTFRSQQIIKNVKSSQLKIIKLIVNEIIIPIKISPLSKISTSI